MARKTDKAGLPVTESASDDMSVADLARAILAREIRPRVSQVRRLAEEVLKPKAKSKKGKKSRSKKGSKDQNLVKIPAAKKKSH